MTATMISTDLRVTDRQAEIVRAVARGLTNEEIAAELGIGARTVKGLCETLRWKLGAKKRRDIPAAYFSQTGVNPYPVAS